MDQNHIFAHSAAKRTYRLPQMKHIFLTVLMLTVSAVMFLSCRGHGGSNVITIKVKGDQYITVKKPETKSLTVARGSKWAAIKGKIEISCHDDYDLSGWKLNNASGTAVTDETVFNNDSVVFAVSAEKPGKNYYVHHLLQNVDNNDYTHNTQDDQTLRGDVGTDTKATAKSYPGFTAQSFDQKKIAADNITVVEIKYNRNNITLTFDLDGGTTTTSLESGNTLKGRFGAPVSITDPVKTDYIFAGWKPALENTFPPEDGTYTAQWTKPKITIQGDERIKADTLGTIEVNKDATWADVEAQAKAKAILKNEWLDGDGDYEIYEWRLNNRNGVKLDATHPFTKDTTVYAVTNYKREKFRDGFVSSTLDGYTGSKPKGIIIIPERYTTIGADAFAECSDITNVTLPNELTAIGEHAFRDCTNLTAIDIPAKVTTINKTAFAGCTKLATFTVSAESTTYYAEENIIYSNDKKKLVCTAPALKRVHNILASVTEIEKGAFLTCSSLEALELPPNLETIGEDAFLGCTSSVITIVGNKLTTIKMGAFGYNEYNWCQKIRIPQGAEFDDIVTKVKDVNYPEGRIERY
ncbi:leucine-rich repeat protein [Treponema sp. OMZ 305]|uniref:leucine-rich repeat protein n=1 Tax=Treponema sp. OMZ 305 TaxID=1659192 RepID=UPI0020A2E6C4|nr:leucine-rich repeat protein [Treponema sp. OMZ 305]UTC58176.1 leucine-rich repeat protein [Treponema sp. OMZ 305]